jgi:8-oxo-dGTP diphosphatase
VADVRVVGVAIVAPGPTGPRLLAARRTAPADAAGAWELPGGKVHPGEPIGAAAVREVSEELGCTVRVTGVVDRVEPIRSGLVLEVVTAEPVAGEPVPLEHDALRWLGPDELRGVRWLPADVPFLPDLAALLRRPSAGVDP